MSTPIVPAQSHPPLMGMGNLFDKTWWLFFEAVMRALRGQTRITYGTLNPDEKPVLGGGDAGWIFVATDYGHRYRWSGSAWEWDYGENGSAYIVAGEPNSPAGYWQACDGTTVDVAQPDGTLVATAVPDMLTNEPMIQGSATPGAQRAATRAVWESGAKTADENAHTHGVNIPPTPDYALGGADAYPGGLVSTGAGSAHHHVLNDSVSLLKKFTEADGGMPLRVPTVFYFRR